MPKGNAGFLGAVSQKSAVKSHGYTPVMRPHLGRCYASRKARKKGLNLAEVFNRD